MKTLFDRRSLAAVILLTLGLAGVWVFAGSERIDSRARVDLEPNMAVSPKLLFIHQDAVTSFPATGDGVRTGTMRGAISGAAVTNFQFLPVPPPEFASDDLTLLNDIDGDQILFRVQVDGHFIIPLQGPEGDPRQNINQIGGPFSGIYEVVEATGKYQYLIGRKLPCKGIGMLPAKNPAIGSVYAEIYSDTFDF